MNVLITLLYVLFCLSAVVLIVVVLLQEGKGGGFGSALGTHGQETFGPGARGINQFTMIATGVFLVTAVGITYFHREGSSTSILDEETGAPAVQAPAEVPAGGAPPSSPPAAPPPTPSTPSTPSTNGG